MKTKDLITIFIFVLVFLNIKTLATTYYVDFESGNDINDGLTTATAWKHAPGDLNATNNVLAVNISPGDIILFKGGVSYKGSVSIPASGEENNLIHYIGDSWPGLEGVKAIFDGSEQITGWINEGDNIYSTEIPEPYQGLLTPFTINLHEYNYQTNEDEFLWISQDPNPEDWFFFDDFHYFYTVTNQNLTRTTITDSIVFNQPDSTYWKNSSVLVWVNPNMVRIREITSFNPLTHTITFDDLGEDAIYPDQRDQYFAIYNSLNCLDQEGEFFMNLSENKIYLHPRYPESIDSSISFSVRKFGFNINAKNHIEIKGFVVKKYSGSATRDGLAIGCHSSAYIDITNIVIRDNEVIHNRHTDRANAVYLSHASNSVIENNIISNNPRLRGILVTSSDNIKIENNSVIKSGATSIGFFTVTNSQILNNTINDSKGSHANGITLYLGCINVLVVDNIIRDSNTPMTVQDCGNIYYINNLIDAGGRDNSVNEWSRTSNGPWASGEIVFLNNTFINNEKHGAVNIGTSSVDLVVNDTLTIPGNSYIFINNIVDGGASHSSVIRNNNIYTGLSWNQTENYGWALNEGEMVITDLNQLFVDPGKYDFQLKDSSQAINAGIDVSQYYPIETFPDFDFTKDLVGNLRGIDGKWDIGAYEYTTALAINSVPTKEIPLLQNYPNPFKSNTSIAYSLPENSDVVIALYDVTGRKVQTLFKGHQIAGKHTLDIELKNIEAGVFFFKLEAGTYKAISKCIITQ